MKRKILVLLFVVTLCSFFMLTSNELTTTSRSLFDFFDNQDTGEISREDLLAENYYRMVAEDGKEIMVTGRKIHIGDEYLTSNNQLYRVYRVRNYVAEARFIREVGAIFAEEPQSLLVRLQQRFFGAVQPVQKQEKSKTEKDKQEKEKTKNKKDQKDKKNEDLQPQAEPKRLIGVYHTHNAESYVPTDGTDSIVGKGGIHKVGDSFTKALQEKDIKVIRSNTLHLPHDRGAYRRSRVTAEEILKKGPDVIFDVHRDAGPANVYAAEVAGEAVTQVQFVVGRQNPQMQTVRQFALDLKNTADEIHPNLVKGIFMARGNYNQDLTATSMLIEVGTHLNQREKAQDGAALFADVVSYYFYGPEDEDDDNNERAAPAPLQSPASKGGGGAGNVGRAAARNAFWMFAVSAVLAAGFYFLNTPLGAIREKLAPWFSKALPYTEKGDIFLASVQEKIRHTAILISDTTMDLLRNGDQYTASWQERIQDFVQTIKEKAEQLRNRDKLS
ncbi:MAG TPA: stage II sporulation protein P [Oscillospiraceae bacterium]|nr:stage II sporulation protein P [Oscillospiraceae bacterium]